MRCVWPPNWTCCTTGGSSAWRAGWSGVVGTSSPPERTCTPRPRSPPSLSWNAPVGSTPCPTPTGSGRGASPCRRSRRRSSARAYFYELLYSAFKARRWIKVVDALRGASLLDQATGLLLGTIATLGLVSDQVTDVLASSRTDLRGTLTVAITGFLLMLWFGIKATTRASALHVLFTSIGSLVAALMLTWILLTPAPVFPAIVTLVGIRWLVIDVVAYTADSSGLLDRLLPKS